MIQNFQDFCRQLLEAGFTLGSGGNDEGVFALLEHGWDSQPPGSALRWHSGDAEVDPWEWRIRVLDERDDIAYGKIFFKKSGYITKEWYPYFLTARRGGMSFDEAYHSGTVSHEAKRIYNVLCAGSTPLHAIKALGGFGREDKSRFDRALTELQMKLFVTMCGRRQKVSAQGAEYGWASTMFCTTESFWGREVFDAAGKLTAEQAQAAIAEQIFKLNPEANPKKVEKFILGK